VYILIKELDATMTSLIRIDVEIEMAPSTITSPKLVDSMTFSVFLIVIYLMITRCLIKHPKAAKCLQNGIA
jgi:hypothetical protein